MGTFCLFKNTYYAPYFQFYLRGSWFKTFKSLGKSAKGEFLMEAFMYRYFRILLALFAVLQTTVKIMWKQCWWYLEAQVPLL